MTTNESLSPWDAIVIGGSAAGLSAALMLGRARRRVLVIDAGSPRNRFASHMHGVLGNEGTPPAEFLQSGREEASRYGVEFATGTVDTVTDAESAVSVALADGRTESARAVIVASGITDVLPDIPGLAPRWGTSVLHCPYCHGWEVRDQRLAVLATSPMALHQVRLIRQLSDRVVLFSAGMGDVDAEEAHRLRARGIEIADSPVVEVLGEGPQVTGVRTADGAVREVDAIFTAGAPHPHDGFLAGLSLERADLPMGLGSFLAVDTAGKTSHPRVWAVGNVANPMANVPVAVGTGSMTGAAVNGFLVEEDFARALVEVAS